MALHCPYLGLDGNRHQVLSEPTPRHRCHKPAQPERVGASYQAQVCLGLAYLRCPRLVPSEPSAPSTAGSKAPPAGSARGTQATPRGGTTAWARQAQVATPRSAGQGIRRPVTLTEMVAIGLGISLVSACFFVGLAILYRLQVGPGMNAAPEVAVGPNLSPTLVPTFTPVITTLPAPDAPGGPATSVTLTATLAITTPAASPTPGALPARPPAASPPTRLVIPKISLDIPVLMVGTRTTQSSGKSRTVWADVPNAGGFHQTSAYPGNIGNTVINGHRDILGAVFRHLDLVEVGDEITLYVGDVAYPYRVVEILVVPEVFASASQRAENQRLIGYMPEERLTLVTCTPVALATHRLLVIARPALPSEPPNSPSQ